MYYKQASMQSVSESCINLWNGQSHIKKSHLSQPFHLSCGAADAPALVRILSHSETIENDFWVPRPNLQFFCR